MDSMQQQQQQQHGDNMSVALECADESNDEIQRLETHILKATFSNTLISNGINMSAI